MNVTVCLAKCLSGASSFDTFVLFSPLNLFMVCVFFNLIAHDTRHSNLEAIRY